MPRLLRSKAQATNRTHTEHCRSRMQKIMLKSEEYRKRMGEVENRENRWIEKQIELADMNSKKDEDPPINYLETGDDEMMGDGIEREVPNMPDWEVPTNSYQELNQDINDQIITDMKNRMKEATGEVDMPSSMLEDAMTKIVHSDRVTSNVTMKEFIQLVRDAKVMGAPHVSEIYSPPRVTSLAHKFNLRPGFPLDLTIIDEDDGKAWAFDNEDKRQKVRAMIKRDKPWLVIGSPMCRAFSMLQLHNRARIGEQRCKQMLQKGLRHLAFCCEIYMMQIQGNRMFLREHLAYATNWESDEVKQVENMDGVMTVIEDMCAVGMTSTDATGEAPVLKPTKFMTNCPEIGEELAQSCDKTHRHVQLVNGRAAAAQIYPEKLCLAMLRGLRRSLQNRAVIDENGVACVCTGPLIELAQTLSTVVDLRQEDQKAEELLTLFWKDDQAEYWDDVSGKQLITAKVVEARKGELTVFKQHGVYNKVPISECVRMTCKQPIGIQWIDVSKGDDTEMDYRSRLVAKELKRNSVKDIIAAATPLEAKEILFSLAVSSADKRYASRGSVRKLMFIDVWRAYFHALAKSDVYIQLTSEDQDPGMCGHLMKSLYGKRDAAQHLEAEYTNFLVTKGWVPGAAAPCAFHHPCGTMLVVHRDDFSFLGTDLQLDWCKAIMEGCYQIKDRGRLGLETTGQKQIRILNRCLEWTKEGLVYEPTHDTLSWWLKS